VTRVGIGYDSHRFVPGRRLVLGGVTIPHTHGLAGHSDADAVAHALTDAILGAAGAGDIGQLFPDSDPQWKDADSMELLRTAHELVQGRGLALAQADCSVIVERPKLAPHLAAMASAMAARLGVAPGAFSLKAKTNEGRGFIGRGEGLAVIAVVVLEAR
jgi:2-C-methyl-D-erythritol 2,4-cyclodiphosphate synthase